MNQGRSSENIPIYVQRYARMPHWTMREAIALICGINPDELTEYAEKYSRGTTPFDLVRVALLREEIETVKRKPNPLYSTYRPQKIFDAATLAGLRVPEYLIKEVERCYAKREAVREGIEKSETPQARSDVTTTERSSLLTIIAAMAKGGYGHDENNKSKSAVSEIVSDAALIGLRISDDTVRKWLGQAIAHMKENQDIPPKAD